MSQSEAPKFWTFIASFAGLLAVGCVGPTTPFGAIDSLRPPTPIRVDSNKTVHRGLASVSTYAQNLETVASVKFWPTRQVVHEKSKLKIIVSDLRKPPTDEQITVYYGGYDVTSRFLKQATRTVNQDQTRVTYEIDRLALFDDRDNKIFFAYDREDDDDEQNVLIAEFKEPQCLLFDQEVVKTTGNYSPPPGYMNSIKKWSAHHSMNPALVTGLVAQESAFNPKAVSWAKAIGLTQVTSLADTDLNKRHKDWPRSSQIKRYPATVVKALIKTGKITGKDDWRLDPDKSIQGGLSYVDHLYEYWTRPSNYKYLDMTFKAPNEGMTNVILASYNSGAARVKRAIQNKGENYLNSHNLKEAKKYVKRINSFCHQFAMGEVPNE